MVVLFIGLRSPTVGADTLNYVKYFTGQQNYYNFDTRELEVFFPRYNQIMGYILFHSGTLYMLFNTIISLSSIYYLVNKYSRNKCFSITLFFLCSFYIIYFVALRQILGMAFLFWGVIAVIEKIRFRWPIYFVLTIIRINIFNIKSI